MWEVCIRHCLTCQEAPSCRQRAAIRQPSRGRQSSGVIQLVLRRNLPEAHQLWHALPPMSDDPACKSGTLMLACALCTTPPDYIVPGMRMEDHLLSPWKPNAPHPTPTRPLTPAAASTRCLVVCCCPCMPPLLLLNGVTAAVAALGASLPEVLGLPCRSMYAPPAAAPAPAAQPRALTACMAGNTVSSCTLVHIIGAQAPWRVHMLTGDARDMKGLIS